MLFSFSPDKHPPDPGQTLHQPYFRRKKAGIKNCHKSSLDFSLLIARKTGTCQDITAEAARTSFDPAFGAALSEECFSSPAPPAKRKGLGTKIYGTP
jgi:hypothetical protein